MFLGTSHTTQKLQKWANNTLSRLAAQTEPLPTLSQAMAGQTIAEQSYVGLQQVPLHQIKGTVSDGRSRDFDANFRLTSSHSRSRLDSVRQARQKLAGLPPVTLVAVGDAYYVQDGHHRVSVFRACEETTIAAHVTVLVMG